MRKGSQLNPHKYLQRFRRPDGRWAYLYAPTSSSYEAAIAGTEENKVVIAHGAPTSIRVDKDSAIVEGPPNLVGRQLFKNTNPKKSYFGVARDPSGKLPPAYLYPESYVKTITAKKAAKFVKAGRGIVGLNKKAELLLATKDPVLRDYGLAVWLNNNTQMRIGAHATASSVAPTERAKIIKLARDNKWSSDLKQRVLDEARKPTYGLLTLKKGHVSLMGNVATFRFIGKSGKENTYSTPLPRNVLSVLAEKKYGENTNNDPEQPLFDERVNYKKIYRMYKLHGITPHVARGHYADMLVKQLMENYRVRDSLTGKAALKEFNAELESRVSNHLNHSRSVTEKSYLSPITRQALTDFRNGLEAHVGVLRESYTDTISDALGEAVLWLALGVGNTVI